MFEFLKIFLKNIRIIIKSKFSLLLILIGPLALISLFSFGVIGTGLSSVEASFFSEETGEIRNVFLGVLGANSFIVEETSTFSDCLKLVRTGNTNVCIVLSENPEGLPLPKDLSTKNLKNFKNLNEGLGVEIYVDFSKQRIVWGIINKVQVVVEIMSDRIQQEIINDISTRFDSSINQIALLKTNIQSLKDQVQISQSRIGSVILNLQNFKTQATATIDSISASVSTLPLSPQLTSILASLSLLRSQINSDTLDTNSLSLVQNGIDQLQQNMIQIDGAVGLIQVEMSNLRNSFSDNGALNANKFIEPIPLSYSSIEDDEIENKTGALNLVDYILPSIISFFLVFTSLTLGSSLVIKERSSNSHIRNYLSKTYKIHFVAGNLIYLMFLILTQVAIILIFSNYFINTLVSDNWESLLLYLSFGVCVFTTLGMCLGYIFNSRDSTILSAVCVSLIFIIFSPLINPIETMPEILRQIFSKSPALIIESGVSKAILFNQGVNGNYAPLIQLCIFSFILIVLCLILHKISRERLVKE